MIKLASKKASKALHWLIDLLEKNNIAYQIAGGLAAKVYGANRPLMDIDVDIPNMGMSLLLPEIKNYLIYGPQRYKDAYWDIFLATLKYEGQEIDLSGADDGLIFSKNEQKWIACKVNFNTASEVTIENRRIQVIAKQELIYYKSMLQRSVDCLDLSDLLKV